MNLRNTLNGLAYISSSSFGHPLRYVSHLLDITGLDDLSDANDLEGTFTDIDNILLTKMEENPNDNLSWCIHHDLHNVSCGVKLLKGVSQSESGFFNDFQTVLDVYSENGIITDDIYLEIVSSFPKPYSEFNFWAMSYDISDKTKYGLKPGVFLKEDYLMPFYTPFLIAHEIIHSLIGKKNSTRLARGLEDGIGDVLGSLFIAGENMPYSLCETMLFHSRMHYPQGQFWQTYQNNTFQAFVLHEIVGITGLFEIVKRCQLESRTFIKNIELMLHQQDYQGIIDSISGNISKPDIRIQGTYRKFSTFPQSLSVSKLAYRVAHSVQIGISIEDISKSTGLKKDEVVAALEELNTRVFLVVEKDNLIVVDETKEMLKIGALRYIVEE